MRPALSQSRARRRLTSNNVLLLITIGLFIAMYAAGCIVYGYKGFSNLQTFLNILISNAGLICIVCGMTAVMLTGGIDISVSGLVAMNCMFLAVGMEYWGWSSPTLMVMIIGIGLVFGLGLGYCVGYLGIQPFIVTMAGMFFGRGMTAVLSTQQVSIVSNQLFVALANLRINMPFGLGAYTNKRGVLLVPYIRITVLVALACVIITYIVLRYTRFGRSLYAVGGNQQSAQLMGLNVKKTRMRAYMLCSFLTSIGSICYCLNSMCGTPMQASGLEMDAISSSVIGGTLLTGGVGNVIGSFFGVLINGTISSLVKTQGKLMSSWSNVLMAILLCFFIVLQAVFTKVKDARKG